MYDCKNMVIGSSLIEKYFNFYKNTSNLFLNRRRDFKPLGMEACALVERNEIKDKGQDHLKIC